MRPNQYYLYFLEDKTIIFHFIPLGFTLNKNRLRASRYRLKDKKRVKKINEVKKMKKKLREELK